MKKSEHSVLYGERDPYFESAIKTAAILGAGLHAIFLVLFFINDVNLMIYINMVSTIGYTLSYFLIKKSPHLGHKIFLVATIEVVIHAVCSVLSIGVDSDLFGFIWLIPLVFILSVTYSTKIKITLALIVALIFFSGTYLFGYLEPIYPVNPDFVRFMSYFGSLSCITVAILIMIYFSRIVQHKEEIILREIHHRVYNNTQITMSVSKMFARNSDEVEVSENIEKINSVNYVIAIIHRSVYFEGDIGVVKACKLIKDIATNSSLVVNVDCQDRVKLKVDKAIPLGIILHVIFSNQNHELTMELFSEEEVVRISGDNFNVTKDESYLELIEDFSDQLDVQLNSISNGVEISYTNSGLFVGMK